jgi:hypothetical protein
MKCITYIKCASGRATAYGVLLLCAIAVSGCTSSYIAAIRESDRLKKIAADSATPPKKLASMAKNPEKRDKYVLEKIASNRNTPPETLAALAMLEEAIIRVAVADNPSTPPQVQLTLAQSDSSWVKRTLANAHATPEALEVLASDKDRDVRRIVAQNPRTPLHCLVQLLADNDGEVRRRAAARGELPPELIAGLAASHDPVIRLGLARNPTAPASVLEKLASDAWWEVREEVARNYSTPPATLAKLAHDSSYRVVWCASENSETPAADRDAAAKSINQMRMQFHASMQRDRHKEASDTATSQARLAELAGDRNVEVRIATAKNLQTPLGSLVLSRMDPDQRVRDAAEQNPACAWPELVKAAGDPSSSPLLLVILASIENPLVEQVISKNPTWIKMREEHARAQQEQAQALALRYGGSGGTAGSSNLNSTRLPSAYQSPAVPAMHSLSSPTSAVDRNMTRMFQEQAFNRYR